MTAAPLLALIERADEKISYEQLRTWVVAQAVRNALQTSTAAGRSTRTTRAAGRIHQRWADARAEHHDPPGRA
jgi:hypothetical protein